MVAVFARDGQGAEPLMSVYFIFAAEYETGTISELPKELDWPFLSHIQPGETSILQTQQGLFICFSIERISASRTAITRHEPLAYLNLVPSG